jgi:2-dehydro-3-deoxygluconokinase
MPKIITLGEVMLRLTPPNFARLTQTDSFNATFGGGEANVAISLAYFGWEAAHVTRFPDHAIGHRAMRFFREQGLDTSTVLLGGSRIGTYFLEEGASLRASQIVYDRQHSAFSEMKPGMIDWEKVLQGADWFHWAGITPALSQNCADVCLEAVQTAQRLGVKVSGDIFYRSNLWQYGKTPQEIIPELTRYTNLVNASQGVMDLLYGFQSTDFTDACQQLQAAFPSVQWIADTDRTGHSATHNDLSASLWNGQELIKTPTFTINPIVDRIGGGDAFVAGLIHGLTHFENQGGDWQQRALTFAVAASALKHTIPGDANDCTVAEVEAIAAGQTGGRVKR